MVAEAQGWLGCLLCKYTLKGQIQIPYGSRLSDLREKVNQLLDESYHLWDEQRLRTPAQGNERL